MSRTFVLFAVGTLLAAPAVAQTQTPVGAGSLALRRGTSPVDTIRALLQRRNPTVDELLAWAEFVRSREVEIKAASERIATEQRAGADQRRMAELTASLGATLQEKLAFQRYLFAGCDAIRPHQGDAEGVLGFQIEKSTEFERRTPVIKEERFVRAPEIVFVEPNTPAAKAGIREGDVWLGIAGRDLVNTYVRDLNDVLKPDNRVDLRLQRDGRELNVEVIARKRQEFPAHECDKDVYEIRVAPGSPGVRQLQVYGAPLPGARMQFFGTTVSRQILAGAVLVELTAERREAFPKVAPNEGVLVDAVITGSAAETAGLRVYDIITRANNEIITSPADLMRVFQNSSGPVTLWVIKGDNQRKVILPR